MSSELEKSAGIRPGRVEEGRLCSSNFYLHSKLKESTRKACLLCHIDNSQKRKSAISCRVCKIPLCTTHNGIATLICFELWHSLQDPKAAHTEQREVLVKNRDD